MFLSVSKPHIQRYTDARSGFWSIDNREVGGRTLAWALLHATHRWPPRRFSNCPQGMVALILRNVGHT